MPSLNKCEFMGHVGQAPEIRDVGSSRVAKFSLACNETWKDKNGDRQERVTWVNFEAWGAKADLVEKYVNKGDPLYVEGKYRVNVVNGDDGEKKYWHSFTVLNLQFLRGKNDSAQSNGDGRAQNRPVEREPAGVGFDDDDDLPF